MRADGRRHRLGHVAARVVGEDKPLGLTAAAVASQ
eukprot:COSAG01_NODE_66678_length_269_cov_0.882353_1_plen_34_part_10